jgi:hypothetical protein
MNLLLQTSHSNLQADIAVTGSKAKQTDSYYYKRFFLRLA